MPRIYLTPQDADSLEAIAERAEKIGPQFRAITKMMEEDGVEVIEVTNYLSMIRGLEALESFCFEAKRRILEIRHEVGQYVARGTEAPELDRRRQKAHKKSTKKRAKK